MYSSTTELGEQFNYESTTDLRNGNYASSKYFDERPIIDVDNLKKNGGFYV